jgi:hypothetical protein
MPKPTGPQFGEFNNLHKSTEQNGDFKKWTGKQYARIKSKPSCSNCGSEWGNVSPMEPDNPNSLHYCQDCKTDYQTDNWEDFI